MLNSILVIGAGELGLAVVNHLVTHPAMKSSNSTLSVLLRPSSITSTDPAKTKLLSHIHSLHITPVPGDIVSDSEASLAAIFQPFTTVIGCTGMTGGSGTQTKLARAALAAGVQRYIPWQFGVDYDIIGYEGGEGIFAEQLDIRALLRGQSTTQWKVVSNGMFMSFVFLEPFGVIVRNDAAGGRGAGWTVHALGSWKNQVTLTDVEDIARGTAEVVLNWETIPEEIVFLTGETISYGQLADVVEKTAGENVERVEWTVEYLKAELTKDPEHPLKRYRVVFAEGKGLAWEKESSFNAKHGIETAVSLEEGARRYLKA